MNSEEHPSTLRDTVLAKIQNNELHMRSRYFFILKIAGVLLLSLVVLTCTVLIGNLVFFSLRLNGHEALLGLGAQGITLFLAVFPWWLLVLDLFFIFLLERLLRQFRFGYRSPALYLFLLLIILAALGGAGIDRGTSFNDDLLHRADEGRLPAPLGAVYQGSRHMPPAGSGVYRGSIVEVASTTISIIDFDRPGRPRVVLIPQYGPAAHAQFTQGEVVLVVGNEVQGMIHAFDIHPIDPDGIPPEHRSD
jgi:hypothetical protein